MEGTQADGLDPARLPHHVHRLEESVVMTLDAFVSLLVACDTAPRDLLGVAVAVVTNNEDPDSLARIKVRFPWLSEQSESHWARLVTPTMGAERGFHALPEVGDEVLVAFEHGRLECAYVLGGLWNGQVKPPK